DCFAQLIGDWALAIWDSSARTLTLAKDPIGFRHLYYSFDDNQVTWSTILDPLVLFAAKTFALCEEYIAGYFSSFPAAHLTPYIGIHSVPPSSSVVLRPGKRIITKYWDFDPSKRIRYRTDAEYEEHFRVAFGEAVRRRLRSDSPILAELSGGMDSSSIVCMADTIISREEAETPRLDTLSFYDDTEPNWNERPYFTKVEEKRGRTGTHVDIGLQATTASDDFQQFAASPTSGARPSGPWIEYLKCLSTNGNRIVLSGIGGDEVTGGVPTPNPELEDLIAGLRLGDLARQLKAWALHKRKPWFHLLFDAARGFVPLALVGLPKHKRPVPWLHPAFVKRNRAALRGYQNHLQLFGPLPSFQENLSTLASLQRQLASTGCFLEPRHHKFYPYLDRSLLEFLYAVPREQIVRPGQRRSLMRRALVSIVPDELLNRRRKAFIVRKPMLSFSERFPTLMQTSGGLQCAALGVVDPNRFAEAMEDVRHGREVRLVPIARIFALESWLRNLTCGGITSTLSLDGKTLERVFADQQLGSTS